MIVSIILENMFSIVIRTSIFKQGIYPVKERSTAMFSDNSRQAGRLILILTFFEKDVMNY